MMPPPGGGAPPGAVVVTLESPRPATLHRVEGGGIGVVGRYVVQTTTFSNVCSAPCNVAIMPDGAQYFVAPTGDPMWGTRRFTLDGLGPSARLIHRPGSRWGVWGGYTLTGIGVAGLITGITIIALGALDTSPDQGVLIGAGVGTAVGGAGFMAGGIALMVATFPRLTVLDANGTVVGLSPAPGGMKLTW